MYTLIDSADIDAIKRVYEFFPIDGVTTNPTILKNAGVNPMERLKEIRNFMPHGAQLHVQTISMTARDILTEAEHILKELGENTYIKIPVFDEGIKAMKRLKRMGINITATAIYTPMQGFIAAKAGASFVAPYVNRLDNVGFDGVEIARQIHDILTRHNMNSMVLAASFKNTQQILNLCEHGIGAITAAPQVLEQLINHQMTESAISDFTSDFFSVAGEDKTMLDL